MLLDTKYFGELEIAEDKTILFDTGIPGFLHEKEFILLDIPGQDVLQILQSIQTPNLAFFITNPHQFYTDYTFKLQESVIETLEVTSKEDVAILSIVTVKEPFQTSTINLQAPLVINHRTKLGKQIILNDEQYLTKASIAVSETKGGK